MNNKDGKRGSNVGLSTFGRYGKLAELDKYEKELLAGWEEVYKKGQLTLWILLALKDGPKHMEQMKRFISTFTNGALVADDKSMYRALRRYYDTELVDFNQMPSRAGPDLKIYRLSEIGTKVLDHFVKRNFLDVFFQPDVKKLLEGSKA